jgi:YcxB-like protein
MELEYTLRPEDFRAFARYYRKLPSGQIAFSSLAVLGVVVIMLAWGLALLLATVFFGDKSVVVGMLIGWLGAGLLQSWLQACRYRSIYRAQCEDPRSEWAVRDVRVVISPDRLRTVARGATTMYEWSRIWHIGVTDKHVFLCITRFTAIIIPRRAFGNTSQFEEFLALARQYQQARERKPKATGIIAGLPPHSDAFTRPDVS